MSNENKLSKSPAPVGFQDIEAVLNDLRGIEATARLVSCSELVGDLERDTLFFLAGGIERNVMELRRIVESATE